MGYFAEINDQNIVINVIVAEEDYIATRQGKWIETFMDGSIRYHYASKGYMYDSEKDAFLLPQPFPSWKLNEKCQWCSPVPRPTDNRSHQWNEETLSWDSTVMPCPFPSWTLNSNYKWEPPVQMPRDGKKYRWDEVSGKWVIYL